MGVAGFSYETDATVDEENVRLYGDVSFGGGYNMLSRQFAFHDFVVEYKTSIQFRDVFFHKIGRASCRERV